MHFITSGPRGYTMVITHEEARALCGVTVGYVGPIGWRGGRVLCSA